MAVNPTASLSLAHQTVLWFVSCLESWLAVSKRYFLVSVLQYFYGSDWSEVWRDVRWSVATEITPITALQPSWAQARSTLEAVWTDQHEAVSEMISSKKLIRLQDKPGLRCVELGSIYTSLYKHINIILFFLSLPKDSSSVSCLCCWELSWWVLLQHAIHCVRLLPLSWIRVGKKLVLAQHLVSDVGERCKCAHGSEPWVQDITSWSKGSAGVGVIWRCSWNLISSRTVLRKLCKLSLAK